MRLAALGLALAVLACGPREDRSALVRRAVGPAPRSGWARLPLDGPAQAARDSLWLGDDRGRAVAARWAPDRAGQPRPLACSQLLLGRDDRGRPTAEFTLKGPEGWPGVRERLQFQFQCKAAAPWAARVEVQRRLPGSGYLTLEQDPPAVLYDFGPSGRRLDLDLRWEAPGYRITLDPVQGSPQLLGVTVQASPAPAGSMESRSVPIVKKQASINLPYAIPIILSGGTSKAGNFLKLFQEGFKEAMKDRFPIQISEIRMAEDPLNAVAQGLLVAALNFSE